MRSRDKIFYYGIISLWKYWALLILEVDKGIFGDLRHFLLFSGYKGSHKGPLGSPTILNGQTIVPWEVGMKYSTMGWFHYGNTERYSLERWTKEYLMIWGICFCCFQAMKGPLGSRMVLNGNTSVPWVVEIKYFTMGWFHYGNTKCYSLERWTKGYLMIWGILFAVFRHWRAP